MASRFVSLVCILLLSGCVSIPIKEQQDIITPTPLTQTEELAKQSSVFSKGNWPEKQWWEIFDSSELNACMEKAIRENPTIQNAKSRIETAKQMALKVRSKLFPLLFFDADANWQYISNNGLYKALNANLPNTGDLVDLSLSFNYEFDFWGKNRNLFRAALGEEKAQEAEYEQMKLVITSAVAQSYYALKTNRLRKRIYERLYATYANVFHLQEILEKNALLSKLPLYVSAEELEESKKLVEGISTEVKADEQMLNALMGQNPDDELYLESLLTPPPKELLIPENISADLVARRPDLMAAIWRAKAIAFQAGAAVADFYPNINLKGFAGLESFHFSNLFDWASRTAGLIPSIHLPIFTAGEIRANLDQKRSEYDEAVFSYNSLLLDSMRQISYAVSLADTLYQQKDSQNKILKLAKARNKLTDLRVASGLDSFLEAYNVKIEVLQKELEDATLTYNQYLSVIQLVKALGGGYLEEYNPITGKENGGDERRDSAE